MNWTCYRCAKCLNEFGACVYPCRRKSRLLPPRRVSTPHNLDPEAYQIKGGDSDYERFLIYGIDDDLTKGG